MVTITDESSPVVSQIQRHARRYGRWIDRMARMGFFMKGTVYLLLGAMTLRAAIDARRPPDRSSVFHMIIAQPFGALLLTGVAAGLLGYALWRVLQALLNPEDEPVNAKGYGKRLARLGSGLIYGGVGVGAAAVVMGIHRATGDEGVQDWTTWGLARPFGRTLVTLAGLSVIGRGVQQIVKAFSKGLAEHLRLGSVSPTARKWATGVGRVGLLARGLVFGMIGLFLIVAALQSRPKDAKGFAGALAALERGPYGPFLLGAVGAGLASYGVFQLVEGRYRAIAKP